MKASIFFSPITAMKNLIASLTLNYKDERDCQRTSAKADHPPI